MSKKNKKHNNNNANVYFTSYHHSAEDHEVLPLWNGTAQATNATELRKDFKDYDLCLFLTDILLPEEIPFTLGVVGPAVKSKIILFAIKDGYPPDDGPYWDWLVATLKKVLEDGGNIGVACI